MKNENFHRKEILHYRQSHQMLERRTFLIKYYISKKIKYILDRIDLNGTAGLKLPLALQICIGQRAAFIYLKQLSVEQIFSFRH